MTKINVTQQYKEFRFTLWGTLGTNLNIGYTFDFIALSEIGRKFTVNRESELRKRGYECKYKMPSSSRGRVGLLNNCNVNVTERNNLIIEPKENN